MARTDRCALGPGALPAQRDRRGQRGGAPAQPDGRPRGHRADHRGEARFRPVAARVLRGVGRPTQETRHHQGDGGVRCASAFHASCLISMVPDGVRGMVPGGSPNGPGSDARRPLRSRRAGLLLRHPPVPSGLIPSPRSGAIRGARASARAADQRPAPAATSRDFAECARRLFRRSGAGARPRKCARSESQE